VYLLSYCTYFTFFIFYKMFFAFFLAMMKQFVSDVSWSDLDYLITDAYLGMSTIYNVIFRGLWCTDVSVRYSDPSVNFVHVHSRSIGLDSRPVHWSFCCVLRYTCQLSHLRRESHACRLKTSIWCLLTPAGQFLTPNWNMWVVAVLLDTISKNRLT